MNILYVDIDTLRPDHMGCYGYRRDTTPNMDAVAKEGIIFTNCYCADAPCLPSRAGFVTGMFGIHSGAAGHGATAADKRLYGRERGFRDPVDENNLWNVFRKAGYYTASISTFAERHSSWWFNAGLNETHNVGYGGMESGEIVLPVAMDWLEHNRNRQNWFLHLHLWDPHTPYRAPASFGNPYENEPLDNWIDDDVLKIHLAHTGPHSINEIGMYTDAVSDKYPRMPGSAKDLAGVKRVFDGYDCGVRHADFIVGQVFDKLKSMGVYDETAIIITSDHGENLGELGLYAEHATADHATCHIPLIIKWPGTGAGKTDDAPHYNIDLAPTLAGLLKIEPSGHWDGIGFSANLTRGGDDRRDFLVLSQMAHVCQRSVRFGEWLYIRTYHDGLHVFDKEMLFNIANDPYEQRNLAYTRPETVDRGAKLLLDWFDNMMDISGYTEDPMRVVLNEGGPFHSRGYYDAYCERLIKTGRAKGAETLKKRREEGWKF